MIHTDPATFTCLSHRVDLTSQVKDQLEETVGPPVAFDPRRFLGRDRKKEPFEVVVSCPGDGTAGSAHEQAYEGRFWT
jgi:hypothetical protein